METTKEKENNDLTIIAPRASKLWNVSYCRMIVRKYLLIRHSTTSTVVSIHNFSFNIISTNKFSPPDVPLGTLSKRLPTRIRTLKIAKVCIILAHTPRRKSSQVYTRNRIYAMEELAHELAQVTRRSICIYVVSPLESWWPSCALTVVDSLSIFPKRLDQTTPLGTPPLPTYALTQAQPSMHAPGE